MDLYLSYGHRFPTICRFGKEYPKLVTKIYFYSSVSQILYQKHDSSGSQKIIGFQKYLAN